MKSPIQRRTAIAALLLAPVLGACGFSAQTDQVYQPAAGVNYRSGDADMTVEILNAQIVSGTDGTGTFVATLDNTASEADRLVNVTGTGITTESKGVALPADGVANLADPASSGKPQLVVTGDRVAAGNFVSLTLVFASGQSTEVRVPVVENTADYDGVPLPTEQPSGVPAVE